MQCFQKDPNLRVGAKKLLKHNWIVGCRRSDAPVAKASADFDQAVEEVKQWNKALTSSEGHLRTSLGPDTSGFMSNGHPTSRFAAQDRSGQSGATTAKGPFTLAKPRPTAEYFRYPELAGELPTMHAIGQFGVFMGCKLAIALTECQTTTTGMTILLRQSHPALCSCLTSSPRITSAVCSQLID